MKISELEHQLANKKKSITALADLISLRTDKNPNFSLLLGAGCSVTSGISSARTLVEAWRAEFCEGIIGKEEQKKHLAQNYPDWYDPSKEYSSLFEKKFDLQRQRRMFVEREVSGKTPSIGYAYLTSLVKADYFHTMFTTNFDDLINEAFYLYSDQRPIVCAHDSSINSITVTSSRPKIVKLHGDYLFDDIKATARETESLEQNMKTKFSEFAKDFGLIVVGYSGGDRSIMDIIGTLLKNDAYFKNGIYWCLRSGSDVSDDLKKLLWKEKVYFVVMDGFDELFAELHFRLNSDDSLPISTLSLSKRPTAIINKLLESPYFVQSKSPIIQRARSQLAAESKRTTLVDLMMPKGNKESSERDEDYSDDEMITRLELSNLLKDGSYREAIEKGRLAIQTSSNSSFKEDMYEAVANAHMALGEVSEALTAVEELIAEQPFIASHHLLKSTILQKYEERLNSINKAIEINPHWYRGYFRKGILLYERAKERFGRPREQLVAEAFEAADTGLIKDPSSDNPCWRLKADLISTYEHDDHKKAEAQQILIDRLKAMNPESLIVLNLRMKRLTHEKDKKEIISLIDEIKLLKQRRPPSYFPHLDEILLEGLEKTDDLDGIGKFIAEVNSTYDLARNLDVAIAAARLLRTKLGKDETAIEILQSCLDVKPSQHVAESLIIALIESGRIDDAQAAYTKYSRQMTLTRMSDLKTRLLEARKDFDGALIELKRLEGITGNPQTDSTTYYLLRQGKYAEAEKVGKEFLETINFSLEAAAPIVNYELACKKNRGKFNEHRLKQLIAYNQSLTVRTAAYAIIGNRREMTENLKKAIAQDRTFKFDAYRWPVFQDLINDADFIKAIGS